MTNREQTILEEAYGRLRVWRDGCREIHERAREARSILLLQDPRQDAQTASRRKDKRTLQLQTLKSTFNNCVADQMDNMPEALMMPERAGLETVAEDLGDIVRHVLANNDFEALHRRRVEDCFATGTAVTQVAWDRDMDGGRGNIALIRWPIEAFLWDPACENLQDGRAVFKVSWHPMSWFKQHYPEQYPFIGSDEAEYSGLGMAAAQEAGRPADENRAMLIEYWYRLYDAQKRRYTVNVALLAGGVLLSHTEDVYRHGMYPFILDVYTPIEGLPVGDGLVQELAPMMRYVNRYASYIDMNLRMASKGRLLIDRNAGIDKEALMNWETDVVEGDRIDPSALQWLQTQPFTGMVTRQMMQLQADIKQDSGQNQFARGETVGGVTAASAISALQEAGGKITRLRTQGLNQGFREMVTQVMWLISQFYDRRRVFFITGREVSAAPEHLFGQSTFPAPPYTVQVQVQRRNPLRQQAQNELVLQAYQMSAQAGQHFPLSTLFELLQVEGKERLLPVLRENEQLPAENAHLREMCKQAGGMMDRQQQNAARQQELVEKLLEERAQLEDTIRLMQTKLDEQNLINEAEKESVEPA